MAGYVVQTTAFYVEADNEVEAAKEFAEYLRHESEQETYEATLDGGTTTYLVDLADGNIHYLKDGEWYEKPEKWRRA